MINIAILDDDVTYARKLKQTIYEYFDQVRLDIQIFDVFHDGTSLLSSKHTYDLLFLDIEVGKENGIEIAKELRKRQPDLLIVVITSYVKYSMDGYKIQAARYLLKPVPKALLFSELDEVLMSYCFDSHILVQHQSNAVRISQKEIYYIESFGRKSKVMTRSEEFISDHAIGHWIQELSSQAFMECYKGICVGLRQIKELKKDVLVLENDKILPIARRRSEDVRQAWLLYQGKQL